MARPALDRAVTLVTAVCRLPGIASYEADLIGEARKSGLQRMVQARDTAGLYRWLMQSFSYQGISDRNADEYMRRHGNADYGRVAASLQSRVNPCLKLESFTSFRGCGYRKTKASCAHEELLDQCPVPRLPLRKGDLNQTAYSLFLFLRDECHGDLIGFIDRMIATTDVPVGGDPITAQRGALEAAFTRLHAVSYKLVNMTFAGLLIAGDRERRGWVDVGRTMVAIDSLVHNFLHRTGILAAANGNHVYGRGCYRPGGCASLIHELAPDVRLANGEAAFPRLLQFAIWSFCAEGQSDICNGIRIDDRSPCARKDCPVGDCCSRIALQPARAPAAGPGQ